MSISRIISLSTAILCLIGLFMLFVGDGALSAEAQTPPRQAREVTWNSPPTSPLPGVEHNVLHSASMDRDVGYNVYLPADYVESKRRYPVVYFLHGAGGTESSDAGGFSALIRKPDLPIYQRKVSSSSHLKERFV